MNFIKKNIQIYCKFVFEYDHFYTPNTRVNIYMNKIKRKTIINIKKIQKAYEYNF